jgi:hypothetical protein
MLPHESAYGEGGWLIPLALNRETYFLGIVTALSGDQSRFSFERNQIHE